MIWNNWILETEIVPQNPGESYYNYDCRRDVVVEKSHTTYYWPEFFQNGPKNLKTAE